MHSYANFLLVTICLPTFFCHAFTINHSVFYVLGVFHVNSCWVDFFFFLIQCDKLCLLNKEFNLWKFLVLIYFLMLSLLSLFHIYLWRGFKLNSYLPSGALIKHILELLFLLSMSLNFLIFAIFMSPYKKF